MLFTITGKHIEITEAIRSYAEDKTSKLPRFYDSINQIEVIIDGSTDGSMSVEIIARAEHSNLFVVTEKGYDIYACIDGAVKRMEGQLRKKKEKERDDKYKGVTKPGAGTAAAQ